MTHPLEKHLTLRNLRIFCTVVESGSMTAAANALGLSQPVVSSLVSDMEAAMGGALIDRSRRPLRLTAQGLVFYEKSKPLMALLNELYASVSMQNGDFRRSMAIGMISSVSAGSSSLIKQLYELIGDLRIITALTPELSLHLKNGEVDMILTSDSDDLSGQYFKTGIYIERFVLVTPPSLQYRECSTISALAAQFPLVGYTARSSLGVSINEYLRKAQVRPNRCVELNTANQVIRAVSQGMGWALSPPTCVLESSVPVAALSFRPATELMRRIVLVSAKNDKPDAEIRAVIGSSVRAHVQHRVSSGFGGSNSWVAKLFEFE